MSGVSPPWAPPLPARERVWEKRPPCPHLRVMELAHWLFFVEKTASEGSAAGVPALGEQHHSGHPAREMEKGETHQAVQPKTTAEQDELALAGRAAGLTAEGDSWT